MQSWDAIGDRARFGGASAHIFPLRPLTAGPGEARVGTAAAARRRRRRGCHPTGAGKTPRIDGDFPTETGRFWQIRGKRWGVPRTCAAKSRISSNGAGFSACESLHMSTYQVRRGRRHSSTGANPARQLSLQPVAVGADDGGNDVV